MSAAQEPMQPMYVWEWPVRLLHWLIALAIVALAVTGLYIGRPFLAAPGQAGERFVMGWMRQIHFLAAVLFSLGVAARLVWMFLGNRWARWNNYVPVKRERLRGLFAMAKFYAYPRGELPYHTPGHNPLAGAGYAAFYFMCVAITLTGFAVYSGSAAYDSPLRHFGFLVPLFGGLQRARWLHHALMWPILLFAAVHIYIAIFVARLERNGTIDSILSGYKLVKPPGGHGK